MSQRPTPPFTRHADNLADFIDARLGMFVHYGLYSMLGRGEWVLNRERIPTDEYRALADRFTADRFDADALVKNAKAMGARYVCLTTMHHDGFALYGSQVQPWNTVNTACGRDLVQETVDACRRHGLRVHQYQTLNHWMADPDAVDALEDQAKYDRFIEHTFDRFRELVTRFNPIECLWYDGWWPFHAEGWQAQKLDAMVREIQPNILVNGRHGGEGDFATPEGHMTAPQPWRPWEACITHNDHWSYVPGDQEWKSDKKIAKMIVTAAKGNGNLLLNVGLKGDGSFPEATLRMIEQVGPWVDRHAEAIRGTEVFSFNLMDIGNGPKSHELDGRSDWSLCGSYTAKGNTLYFILFYYPGPTVSIAELMVNARSARFVHDGSEVAFTQNGGRVTFSGLPEQSPDPIAPVIAIECDAPPVIYNTGGMRIPQAEHPRYDPCPSDIG